MPFKSDKQRRYLWSQKPEVARQIAYKNTGGMVSFGASYDNQMKGNYMNHGGPAIPQDPRQPKKVTSKDRYGNQISVEYAENQKPFDINKLMEKLVDNGVPEVMQPPQMQVGGDVSYGGGDHPGEPMGSDTIPAWLTPGEFVVNKEAMEDPQMAAIVEQINNVGRQKQAAYKAEGGDAMDFAGPESLTDEQIAVRMAAMRQSNPADSAVPMPMPAPWAGRPEGYTDLLHQREGYEPEVYLDTRGKPTVGYGHLLPDEFTSRVGEAYGDRAQHDAWFDEDSARGVKDAINNVGRKRWMELTNAQKAALSSMAFQLGGEGQSKFKNMLDAVKRGDNEAVRREAEDSLWFEQTPTRVRDLQAAFMEDGGMVHPDAIADERMHRDHLMPVYAYRGYDTAIQDAADIEDPLADMSSGWTPPVYEAEEISPMEQAILDEEAMAESQYQQQLAQQIAQAENMVEGGDGDDLGTVDGPAPAADDSNWDSFVDWVTDTSIADARNASFNVKAAENNAEAAVQALAEMQDRINAGEPVNEKTMEMAEKAVAHTQAAEVDAIVEAAKVNAVTDIDYEGVVAGESKIMAEQKAVMKEVAESPEFEEEDDPSKPSEKGEQSQSEVVAAAEEAIQKDPTVVQKAQGFFQEAFSDLFDGKEMARMALMYAGSRALGYSHGGSLNWAAKQYIQRVDAKQAGIEKNAAAFAKSGKFTPNSVAMYQKSGDLGDLSAIKENPTTTGNTMTRTVNGQKIAFQEVKLADGSVKYVDPNGRSYTAAQLENRSLPYEAAFEKGTPEYRARRSRATNDAAGRFEEVWKAEDRFRVGDNEWKTTTKIRPKQAADEFWAWSESVGLDPESDEALNIMTNAYQSAIADGKAGKITPTKLRTYLEAEHIRESTGTKELFMTNGDAVLAGKATPQYVRGDKMAKLNDNVGYIASKSGHSDKAVYRVGISEWEKLDPEDQKLWNSKATDGETGFYKFMNAKLAELATKL